MKGRGLSVYSRDQKAERSWGTGIPVYLFCGGYSGEMERKEREAGKKKKTKNPGACEGKSIGMEKIPVLSGQETVRVFALQEGEKQGSRVIRSAV